MNAVITGASRGIGKAVAEIFALHGYDLFLCSRSEENLWPAVEAIKAKFPTVRVEAQALDLSEEKNCRLLAEWVTGLAGNVDVLVNNAGSFIQGSVSEEAPGSMEAMMNTNYYSAYHLTRHLLGRMRQARSGHIFNICSIAALAAYPGGGSYSVSKSALHAFTKNLRYELKETGIKVTAILPGAVYTDSWKNAGVSQERLMDEDDVAKMILACTQLSPKAVVEEIIMRPQLGDL